VLSASLEGLTHLSRLERLFAEWAAVSPLPADVLGLTPQEFQSRAQELRRGGQDRAREGVVLYSAPEWVRPGGPGPAAPRV